MKDTKEVEAFVRTLNKTAPMSRATNAAVDIGKLAQETNMPIGTEELVKQELPGRVHQGYVHEEEVLEQKLVREDGVFQRQIFEKFLSSLPKTVIRAKGFVRFTNGIHFFSYIDGKWEIKPMGGPLEMVFIGSDVSWVKLPAGKV